jgi:transcriptional regulator with XRE-family HTH domain
MKFPEIVRRARKKKGWSQSELGKALGMADTNISAYENGKGMPSLENAREMAQIFRMTTSQLLGETPVPTHLVFMSKGECEAAGYSWEDPIPCEPQKPVEVRGLEPGRFMMLVNLEGCELLSVLHQLDSRDRRTLLGLADELLRGSDGAGK